MQESGIDTGQVENVLPVNNYLYCTATGVRSFGHVVAQSQIAHVRSQQERKLRTLHRVKYMLRKLPWLKVRTGLHRGQRVRRAEQAK